MHKRQSNPKALHSGNTYHQASILDKGHMAICGKCGKRAEHRIDMAGKERTLDMKTCQPCKTKPIDRISIKGAY